MTSGSPMPPGGAGTQNAGTPRGGASGPVPEVRLKPLLFALYVVSLLSALNLTIVSASLATIVGDLGGVEYIAWVITSYTLATTIALPVYGQLGDIRGRRRIFLSALVVFIAGSVLCGLSRSILELTAARLVQGVGGAGISLQAQTILADVLPVRRRAKYMAILGSVFAIATVAGPLVGGGLTDTVGWRWIFFFSVPFGLVAFVVAFRSIPALLPVRPGAAFDRVGAVMLGVLLASLVSAVSLGGRTVPWTSPAIVALFATSAVAAAWFVRVERRVALPIVPFVMFRDRIVLGALVLFVVVGVGILSVVSYLPSFIQMRYATSATVAGAVEIAIVAGILSASNTTGVLVSRTGRYRLYPVVGTAVAAGALGTLAAVAGNAPLPVIAVLFFFVGLGAGAFMQIALVLIQNQAPQEYVGVATSTANLVRQTAMTLTMAVIGGVFGSSVVRLLAPVRLPDGIAPSELTPQVLRTAPPEIKAQVAAAYTSAMVPILIGLAVVFAIGFAVAVTLPAVHLQETLEPPSAPDRAAA